MQLEKFNNILNPNDKDIYVRTKNKIRCDAEKYSYEEACEFEQIAWLVHESYIVVDVDTKKDAAILFEMVKDMGINCHIFKSRKGAHFVFKEKPGLPIPQVTNTYSSCGIKFDTRTTGKGYIVLPYKQSDRKWIRVQSSKIDELPIWLYPQKKLTKVYTDKIVDVNTSKKKIIDTMPAWSDMGEGDSRNDELFRYFMNLLNNSVNLTVNDKRKSIELLNRYVLDEPLPDSELEATVLREDLTANLKGDEIDMAMELDPDVLANRFLGDHDIITKNAIIFIYEEGYYRPIDENGLHHMLHHKYDKRAKEHKRNEIIKFIRVKTDIRDGNINKDPMMINLVNGRMNLQTLQLDDHIESAYDTIRIPYKYNEDSKPSETLKNFLNFISGGSKKKLTLLFEMIGLCLVKKAIMEKFFILVGEKGANGKSTLLEIIENLLGPENVSNIDLGEIGTDPYAGYELYSKLANIGDDLKLTALKDTGLIKTLTSGKSINAQVKFKDRFKFKNFATMIYAANRIPISYDKSGGFMRRFVIIRFNGMVPVADRDPFLVEKLTHHDYEYILKRSVKAVSTVINTNQLTELEESKKALDQYKTENSSVLVFLQESEIDVKRIHLYPVRELYGAYKEYCAEGGYKLLQKSIFDSEIHKEFNVEKKNTTKKGVANKMRWVLLDD